MSKINDLERQVQSLSADELASFASGLPSSMPKRAIANSKQTSSLENSTPWLSVHGRPTPLGIVQALIHYASPEFWACYRALSAEVQSLAELPRLPSRIIAAMWRCLPAPGIRPNPAFNADAPSAWLHTPSRMRASSRCCAPRGRAG